MRVAIYGRVSTSDKDQNPDTQLLPLREFVAAQGWTVAGEFVDHASATDLRGRSQWRAALHAASRRKIDLVLVWKLDRAFRSVLHASTTLEEFRRWGVGLRSYTEPWADTTSAQGELVFNLLTTFAQFERSLIAERVRAGMARAKKAGQARRTPQSHQWGVGRGAAASPIPLTLSARGCAQAALLGCHRQSNAEGVLKRCVLAMLGQLSED